jgi:hypothetical protein
VVEKVSEKVSEKLTLNQERIFDGLEKDKIGTFLFHYYSNLQKNSKINT